MEIAVVSIHHVGIVVSDLERALRFYVNVLGFRRHPARGSWLVLNATTTLHLIPLGDAGASEPAHHAYRHVALQVADLCGALRVLLAAGLRVWQADFAGNERDVRSENDPIDFGVGTLFVRDPDGNLVEFLERGKGTF